MKKVLSVILALALLMVVCGAALAEGDGSLGYIQEKGTLVLGLDASFPPMGYEDEDGEIVGYDIDLAEEVCKRLGVTLVKQPIDWAAKELELSSKNIDVIWNGMSITPERQEGMALTQAYLNNQIVLLVKGDEYQTKEDLLGQVIGTQSGSFAEEVLETYEDYADYYAGLADVMAYEDYLTAILDLQNGQIQGILIDLVVANYLMANLDDDSLRTIDSFEDDLYAAGFRKEDVELRDAVDQILVEMAEDGTIAAIAEKWFGEDISLIGK